jgi:methionine sulfoxide reductase heme-binding subunit
MAAPCGMARTWQSASVWALYAVGFVPAVWYFYLGATGQLIGNSVKVFEHMLGIWALRFLLATLAVTPLRDLTGVSLLRYRRALGLLTFYYVVMHFLTYLILDQNLNLSEIATDISKRPFIMIGMACLVLLIPLAATSNRFSIRRLGSRWNRLHQLSYFIVLGGAVHYTMAGKVGDGGAFRLPAAGRPARRLSAAPAPNHMQWRRKQRLATAR